MRTGRLLHTFARAGWIIFALIGAALMVVLAGVYAATPGEEAADNGVVANFIGGSIIFVPIGGGIAALLGLGVQYGARAWLRSAPPVESRTARGRRLAAERVASEGLQPGSAWARRYESCLRSVAAYHDIVGSLTESAARDWLADVGGSLDAELTEALRLARLGESLDVGDSQAPSPTAVLAGEQLDDAVRSFAETTERAAAIALDLRADSDFAAMRAQLDVLAEQAPHLRADQDL